MPGSVYAVDGIGLRELAESGNVGRRPSSRSVVDVDSDVCHVIFRRRADMGVWVSIFGTELSLRGHRL